MTSMHPQFHHDHGSTDSLPSFTTIDDSHHFSENSGSQSLSTCGSHSTTQLRTNTPIGHRTHAEDHLQVHPSHHVSLLEEYFTDNEFDCSLSQTHSLDSLHMCSEDDSLDNLTSLRDLFPELWIRVLLYCPQKTICDIGRANPHFQQLIDQHEHMLAVRRVNSELVCILKVENKLIVEKLKFLEDSCLEYLINGKRFSIFFRVTHTLLLHMDFCIKFRSTYQPGSLQREKDQIDKEFMRIMRFPIEMHTFLKKRCLMQREFRPYNMKLNDTDKDMHRLWNYFVETKCLEHAAHVDNIREKLKARPPKLRFKGLRWYLSHSGYESLSTSQKLDLAEQLRDVLVAHENCTIKHPQEIVLTQSADGALEMRYVERTKSGLLSLLGKSKRKTIVVPIPQKYWCSRTGEFWFDGMWRFIVSRFVRP